MKNKAIVTGGAGFIGSHLVDRLISEDFNVLVIDNLSTGKQENINTKAEFLKKDINDKDIESIILNFSPDYIFHLAAQIDVRKSLMDPLWDANINIQGTLNLLNASSKSNIKKFIFSSTGGAIYGEAKNATEDFMPNPLSPYGVSKLACEHYLQVYSEWKGLSFTSLRYGNVYGPRQDPTGEAGVVAIFCRQLLLGEDIFLYGYGKMIRDYVFVSDIIEANIKSINMDTVGIYNIATSKSTSVNELFNILKKISGRDIRSEYKEAREGEIFEVWLNTEKAKRELNWEYRVSLKEGLSITYKWFQEHINK